MRPTRYDLASGQDTEATQGWQKAQGNRRDVRNQRDLRACGQAADNRGGFSQAYASRSRLGIQSEAVPAPQGISPAKGEGVLLAPQGSKGEWRCLRSRVVPDDREQSARTHQTQCCDDLAASLATSRHASHATDHDATLPE